MGSSGFHVYHMSRGSCDYFSPKVKEPTFQHLRWNKTFFSSGGGVFFEVCCQQVTLVDIDS